MDQISMTKAKETKVRNSLLWPALFVAAVTVNAIMFAVSYQDLRVLHYCGELRDSLPTAFDTSNAKSNGDAQRDKIRQALRNIGHSEAEAIGLRAPLDAFVNAATISDWPQQADAMLKAYGDFRHACNLVEKRVGYLDIARNALSKFSPK